MPTIHDLPKHWTGVQANGNEIIEGFVINCMFLHQMKTGDYFYDHGGRLWRVGTGRIPQHKLYEVRDIANGESVWRGQDAYVVAVVASSKASQGQVKISQGLLHENISALSAEFHTNQGFSVFYDNHGPTLDGFPGIWKYMVEAAEAFTIVDTEFADQEHWIDSITEFARILCFGEVLMMPELKDLARRTIQHTIDKSKSHINIPTPTPLKEHHEQEQRQQAAPHRHRPGRQSKKHQPAKTRRRRNV